MDHSSQQRQPPEQAQQQSDDQHATLTTKEVLVSGSSSTLNLNFSQDHHPRNHSFVSLAQPDSEPIDSKLSENQTLAKKEQTTSTPPTTKKILKSSSLSTLTTTTVPTGPASYFSSAPRPPSPTTSSISPSLSLEAHQPNSDPQPSTKTPASKEETPQTTKQLLWEIWMQNWFLLGLACVIILARFEPSWGKTNGPIRPEYTVKYGVTACIFLLSGLSMKTKAILHSAMNYRAHLFTQLNSFIVIPLFVKALTSLLGLSPLNSNLLAGMAFTSATPTTISSNVVMTGNSNGTEPLALFNATLGNLLGVFLSPVIALLLLSNTPQSPAGGHGLDYSEILLNLGTTIVLPVFVGQFLLWLIPNAIAWAKSKVHFPTLNSTCLLILVWSIFCDAFSNGTFTGVTAWEIIAIGACQALTFWSATFFLAFVSRARPRKIRILKIMDETRVEQDRTELSRLEDGSADPMRDEKEQHYCTEGLSLPRTRLQWLAEPMTKADTVAILFCGATKSVAVGIPLIKILYPSVPGQPGSHLAGLLATPLLIYHVEQLFSGAFMVRWLRKWVNRGEETLDSFDEADQKRQEKKEKNKAEKGEQDNQEKDQQCNVQAIDTGVNEEQDNMSTTILEILIREPISPLAI